MLHRLKFAAFLLVVGCAGAPAPRTAPDPVKGATAATTPAAPGSSDEVTVRSELTRLIAETDRINGVEARYSGPDGSIMLLQVWANGAGLVMEHDGSTIESRIGEDHCILRRTTDGGGVLTAGVDLDALWSQGDALIKPHLLPASEEKHAQPKRPRRAEVQLQIESNADPSSDRPHNLQFRIGYGAADGPLLAWLKLLADEQFHGTLFEDHLRFDMDAEGPVFIEISRAHGFPTRIGRENTPIISLQRFRTGVEQPDGFFALPDPSSCDPQLQARYGGMHAALYFAAMRIRIVEDWKRDEAGLEAALQRTTRALTVLYRWRLDGLGEAFCARVRRNIAKMEASIRGDVDNHGQAAIQDQLDAVVRRWRDGLAAALEERRAEWTERMLDLAGAGDEPAPAALRPAVLVAARQSFDMTIAGPLLELFQTNVGKFESKK